MAWMTSFRDLDVWKKAHDLVLDIYQVTERFPDREKYGIVAQLRRSSASVPANIAEGFGRPTTGEFLQSLGVSNGSLEETRYFLIVSFDLGLLQQNDYERLEGKCSVIAQMLGALRRSLRAKSKRSPGTRSTGHETR